MATKSITYLRPCLIREPSPRTDKVLLYMELKGKALKEFWLWYLLPENQKKYKTYAMLRGDNAKKVRFIAMSFTERYGVFVDFFDSVGIWCDVQPVLGCPTVQYYLSNVFYNDKVYDNGDDKPFTREESRIKTINRADEIYNEIN